VNGRRDIVGADHREFETAIRTAAPAAGPTIALRAGSVAVGAAKAPAEPANVWLVRYDPRVRDVPIRRGENGGKTLPHRNIVVEFVSLGLWKGQAAAYAVPSATDPNLATAILVQSGVAGPILAAAKS
jgi:hypothetical protein